MLQTHFLFPFVVICFFSAILNAAEPKSYKVGEFEVIPLEDASSTMNPGLFRGITTEEIEKIVPDGKIPSSINVFLLKGKDHTILVDTGLGESGGRKGQMFAKLKEYGIDPGSIDTVLITHLHGDHFGGLTRGGEAAFPKAMVYLAKIEKDYWTGGEQPKNVAARAALAAYGDRVKTLEVGEEDLLSPTTFEGVRGVGAFGHTPGHTLFLIESGGERLLIIGDLLHGAALQFPRPDVGIQYDTDVAEACRSRLKVLQWAAEKQVPVAGMHLPFPGIGTVEKDGDGYRFVPK